MFRLLFVLVNFVLAACVLCSTPTQPPTQLPTTSNTSNTTSPTCQQICSQTAASSICDDLCPIPQATQCALSSYEWATKDMANGLSATAASAPIAPVVTSALLRLAKLVPNNVSDFVFEQLRNITKLEQLVVWAQNHLDELQPAAKYLSEHAVEIIEPNLAELLMIKYDLVSLGDYDRCHNIAASAYCTLNIAPQTRMPRNPFLSLATFGFCVPESCAAGGLGEHVNQLIRDLINATDTILGVAGSDSDVGLGLSITINCGDFQYSWDAGTWVMLVLAAVLVCVVASSTLYESRRNKQAAEQRSGQPQKSHPVVHKLRKVFLCFSLIRGNEAFWKTRTGKMNSFDGVRVLSMCWVLMGHTMLFPVIYGPGYANPRDLLPMHENGGGNPNSGAVLGTFVGQVFMSAFFSVDSFFFLSGYLAVYISYRKLAPFGSVGVLVKAPLVYLQRFLRLTPLLAAVLFFYMYAFLALMKGPFFQVQDFHSCRDYWWANILSIQNFFKTWGFGGAMDPGGIDWQMHGADTKLSSVGGCYFVSWYLSADTMYFLLVPIIVSIAIYSKRIAIGICLLGASASLAYTLAAAGWFEHASDVHVWSTDIFELSGFLMRYYFRVETRIPVYLIGSACAIVWLEWQSVLTRVVQSSMSLRIVIFVVASSLLGSVFWGLYGHMYLGDSGLSPWLDAAYTVFSRPAWVIGLALMMLLCFTQACEPMQWLLELPIMRWGAKLSFTMYLAHPMVLIMMFGQRTQVVHWSPYDYATDYISALTLTGILGVFLHLCIEQPAGWVVDEFVPKLEDMLPAAEAKSTVYEGVSYESLSKEGFFTPRASELETSKGEPLLNGQALSGVVVHDAATSVDVHDAVKSVDAALEARFKAAVDFAQRTDPSRGFKSHGLEPNTSEKLELYKLFKQATEGDYTNGREPSFFSITARVKYSAWKDVCGMSQQEAMLKYIKFMDLLRLKLIKKGHKTNVPRTPQNAFLWDSEGKETIF